MNRSHWKLFVMNRLDRQDRFRANNHYLLPVFLFPHLTKIISIEIWLTNKSTYCCICCLNLNLVFFKTFYWNLNINSTVWLIERVPREKHWGIRIKSNEFLLDFSRWWWWNRFLFYNKTIIRSFLIKIKVKPSKSFSHFSFHTFNWSLSAKIKQNKLELTYWMILQSISSPRANVFNASSFAFLLYKAVPLRRYALTFVSSNSMAFVLSFNASTV